MCGSMVDIQSPAAEIRRGKKEVLEMWANAQRDGRPAQYRWRRLFNAAVRLCINDAKTRNPLKLAGCPKLTKRSQPLVGRSSPYCQIIHFCIYKINCWWFFASCIFSEPRAARFTPAFL